MGLSILPAGTKIFSTPAIKSEEYHFAQAELTKMGDVHPGDHSGTDSLKKDHAQEGQPVSVRSLRDVFVKGHVEGEGRTFLMSTVNYLGLNDHYALAAGAQVHYHTANIYGFEAGFGGNFVFNVFSSDLGVTDPLAKKYAIYELQLFDLKHPDNRHDLDRLEEFYLRYRFGKSKASFVQYGREGIHTPLINMQDTRMKPYLVQGLWAEIAPANKWMLYAGWIDHFAPRSTLEWVKTGHSIGIYGQGYLEDGRPSHYEEKLHSRGVAILGVASEPVKGAKLQLWNYWVDNIFNTTFAQADWHLPIGNGHTELILGAQALTQWQVGEGGHPEPDYSYANDDWKATLFGGQAGIGTPHDRLLLSALRITGQGRFLFPREWGREQFYTTIARSLLEGLGDTEAFTARYIHHFNKHFTAELDYSHVSAPGMENYQVNKYRQVSYDQVNLDLNYHLSGWWQGMSLHMLYVYRHTPEEVNADIAPLYYAANFHNFNLIMQFHF